MKKIFAKNQKTQKGIAALIVVLVISVSTLIMALNSSFLGLGELDLGYTSQKGGEALVLADSCVEETLRRLRIESNYSGGVLNIDDGSCIISIVVAGGDRTITVESDIDGYHKKIQVGATLSGRDIAVNFWQELDN